MAIALHELRANAFALVTRKAGSRFSGSSFREACRQMRAGIGADEVESPAATWRWLRQINESRNDTRDIWRRPVWGARRYLRQELCFWRKAMTTYVTLYNFTEQGLKAIKDTVKRTEAAKKAAAANGMKVKEVLWLQGQYDLVVISESDDDTKGTAFALNTLKMGNVRGQTLRAFTAAEMEKILEHVA
jgi:uncharacterized protein with GYD domain